MTSRVARSVVAALVLTSGCKLQRAQQSNGAIAQSGTPQSALASAAVRTPALSASGAAIGSASSAKVLARQETSSKGVTAEVLEFRRRGSTLTARVRFVNEGSTIVEPIVTYDGVYLMDASTRKKYEVLKDESNRYIAALHPGFPDRWSERIGPGETQTIWIKFPAPAAEVTALTLVLPKVTPFEDLAIQS
jgi:hypothetical protein